MTFQEKRTNMSALVERWQSSGLSQNNFAIQEGMSLVKLRYWIKKQKKAENTEPAFVQLKGFTSQGISIRYPNGVEMMLPAQIPASVIRSLIFI